MKPVCYIIGAGRVELLHIAPQAPSFVIAADGGYARALDHQIPMDLILGDFDSLGYVPTEGEVLQVPVEKDFTDTMMAVREGFDRGYTTFVIYGGLGGRVDHSMANFQTLCYIANRGGIGLLATEEQCVTAITDRSITFDRHQNGEFSVFSVAGTAAGVTIEGAKYPLHGASIRSDDPIGISNRFQGPKTTVSVESGSLVIFWRQKIREGIAQLLEWQ